MHRERLTAAMLESSNERLAVPSEQELFTFQQRRDAYDNIS